MKGAVVLNRRPWRISGYFFDFFFEAFFLVAFFFAMLILPSDREHNGEWFVDQTKTSRHHHDEKALALKEAPK